MATLKRILKEIVDFKKNQPLNVGLIQIKEDDVFNYFAIIIGPDYSPYENGIFYVNIRYPDGYPFKPPKCTFLTRIFHPNINSFGSITLDILRDQWSPALTIRTIILSISSLLSQPNFDDYLVPEIAHLYKKNKYEYYKKAREFAEMYADAPPNHEFYYLEGKERIDYELNHFEEMKEKYSEIYPYKAIYLTKINDIKWKAKIDREDFEIEFPDNYPYSPPNFTLTKKDYVIEEKIKSFIKKVWFIKLLIKDILYYIYHFLSLSNLEKSRYEFEKINKNTDNIKEKNLINLLLKEKCKNNVLEEKNRELEKKLEEYSMDKGQIYQEKKLIEQEINQLNLTDNNKSYFQNEEAENIESKIKSLSFDDLFKIINSRIGLINLGNTCYINSPIQILLHCSIFMEKLLINVKFTSKKTQFTNNLLYVCQKMKNADQVVNIKEFKELIGKKDEIFHGERQNDSQEFLRKLLENISQELNRVENPIPWKDLSNSFLKTKLLRFQLFYEYSRKREKSIITDLFYSIICTTLTCECKYECYPFQELLDIPLLIPKNHNSITINEILRNFFSIQYVEKLCQKCKNQTKHKQNIKLASPSEILILSLQRFKKNQIKDETLVEFEEIIDVSNLIDYECGYQGETIYNLFAVINHYGFIESGHYKCCIKLLNKDWYEFNDSVVNKIDFKDIKKENVYTLFYKKIT